MKSVKLFTVSLHRLKSAKVTDKRVRVMNEIISGMRLIKMYAWEWAFHEYVKKIRKLVIYCIRQLFYALIISHYREESKLVTQASMVRAFNFSFFIVAINFLNFVTFSVYTGTGNTLTARNVFTFISLISYSRLYFVHFFVIFMVGLQEMRVAVQRIQVSPWLTANICVHYLLFLEIIVTTRTCCSCNW